MNSARIVAVPGYRMEWAAGNWRPFVFLVRQAGRARGEQFNSRNARQWLSYGVYLKLLMYM